MTGPTWLDDEDDDLAREGMRHLRGGPKYLRGGPAGQRVTELWAWVAYDPMTGGEGVMGVALGRIATPAFSSRRDLAEGMKPFVDAAVRGAQEPRPEVTLRRFVLAEEVEAP